MATTQSNQQPAEEKLEFLNRSEVRTMAKDIAALRSKELEAERNKIVAQAEQPKTQSKGFLEKMREASSRRNQEHAQLAVATAPLQGSLMPTAPKTKTRLEKILIRVVLSAIIFFFLFNALAFAYWYLTKGKSIKTPAVTRPVAAVSTPTATPEPTATQLTALFPVQETRIVEAASLQELPFALSVAYKEQYQEGFTRLQIQNIQNIEELGIRMPAKVSGDSFMLFLYVAQDMRRAGVVLSLQTTQNLQELLKAWEPVAEANTSSFFDAIGAKGSAYTKAFRETVYKTIPVRFQTFSAKDFGIVYAIVANRLIITSSLSSAKAAIDILQR